MKSKIDISENEIVKRYPDVLDILLFDHTTRKNIFWATDNYEHLGKEYFFDAQILPELITGKNGSIIMPRIQKDKLLQETRSRDMAEVFTPSWVCNAQNNLIDNNWFGREDVFNTEVKGKKTNKWITNKNKIIFSKNKTWKDYVRDTRLEIACGEAPYITSRYDATTGKFIPINDRIGILDRKLRVISENVESSGEWLKAAQTAYKNTYAYEWQGDNLLIAREAMLISFVENYIHKFGKEPLLRSIKYIAYIISWNVWQMDGIKGVVPNSCKKQTFYTTSDLFGKTNTTEIPCEGCMKENIYKHNGTYCLIKDWANKDKISGEKGRGIKFIDLLNKHNEVHIST